MIAGYFRDKNRVIILGKNGEAREVLGRFPLNREVAEDNVTDDALREEAEILRQKINMQLTRVSEGDLIRLIEEINRLTVACKDDANGIELSTEDREFYELSIQRASQRLRAALKGA